MKKEEVKINTEVIYWAWIGENGERDYPTKTYITSEPWEISGEWVCRIVGASYGGVSIKHLDLVTPGSLVAARLKGLKTEPDALAQSMKKALEGEFGIEVIIVTDPDHD